MDNTQYCVVEPTYIDTILSSVYRSYVDRVIDCC